MSLFTLMPEELLDLMVQNLAYPLEPFHREVDFHYQLRLGHYKPTQKAGREVDHVYKLPSSGLLVLSQVNRQLRRLCRPLLFAYVHIRCSDDAEKIVQGSAKSLFAKYAKTLILGGHSYEYSESTLLRFLDVLENLSCVDFRCDIVDPKLFKTINQHHTVSTIYVDSQDELHAVINLSLDLSKVTLRRFKVQDYSDLYIVWKGLAHQTISHLHLLDPMLLAKKGLDITSFSGLHELTLIQRSFSRLSWLPTFASAHPHLKIIRFMSDYPYESSDIPLPIFPPFLKFLENLQRQAWRSFRIHQVAFSRTNNADNADTFDQQWCVTMLRIYGHDRFLRCSDLALVGCFFPEIKTLGLHFRHVILSVSHIVDLIEVLECLPLQRLELMCMYDGLCNEAKSVLQASPGEVLPCSTIIEAGIFWYISLIAQHIPTLRALWITDHDGSGGYDSRDLTVRDIPGEG